MRVTIEFERAGPAQGKALREDGTLVEFSGWLDLLQVLESWVGSGPLGLAPGDLGGELDPGGE